MCLPTLDIAARRMANEWHAQSTAGSMKRKADVQGDPSDQANPKRMRSVGRQSLGGTDALKSSAPRPLRRKRRKRGKRRKRSTKQFSGVVYPVETELYLGYWSSDKTKYPVMLLPWGDLGRALLEGTLKDTGLLDTVPKCYAVDTDTGEIVGWAKGHEDGGRLVTKREFPVAYFDGRVSVGWLQASNLSIFDFEDPDWQTIPNYEYARDMYAVSQGFNSYQMMKEHYNTKSLPPKLHSAVSRQYPTPEDTTPSGANDTDEARLEALRNALKSPVSSIQDKAGTSSGEEPPSSRQGDDESAIDRQLMQSIQANEAAVTEPAPTPKSSEPRSAVSPPQSISPASVRSGGTPTPASGPASTPLMDRVGSNALNEDYFELGYYEDDMGCLFHKQEGGPFLRVAIDKQANVLVSSPGQVLQIRIDPCDIVQVDVEPLVNGATSSRIVSLVLKEQAGAPKEQKLVFETSKARGREEAGHIHARRFCAWVMQVNRTIGYCNHTFNSNRPSYVRK